MNIINTIKPGFILKNIQDIVEARKKKGQKKEEAKIEITNEYSQFLTQF